MKSSSSSAPAPAKGKGKPEEGEKKYPLFLNKTFAMLKTSKPDIATWAEDGLSFYIIDQTRFVDSVIPQYFKHSNFSSFVRQLNFYGFRKVWSDQLIEMQQNGFEKVLEFKHPFFQRDNPELLSQIKKIVNGSDMSRATCENSDIVALKSDVEELKVHLYMLSNKLVMLSNSVTQLLELKASNLPASGSPAPNGTEDEPSPKKRKTSSSSDKEGGDLQLGGVGNNVQMPVSMSAIASTLASATTSSSSSSAQPAASGSRNKDKA